MADKNAKTNGAVPAQEEKVVLTAEQAAVGQQLFAASQQINEKLQIWMSGVGITGDIVGGTLATIRIHSSRKQTRQTSTRMRKFIPLELPPGVFANGTNQQAAHSWRAAAEEHAVNAMLRVWRHES